MLTIDDGDQILRIAHYAARVVYAQYALDYNHDDFNDMQQSAAEQIIKALIRTPNARNNGYYLKAAIWGAKQHLMKLFAQNDIMQKAQSADDEVSIRRYHEGKPWQEPLSDDEVEKLTELFYAITPNTNAQKRLEVAKRDAILFQLLSRGLTQKEIGKLYNISRSQVGMYRQRARAKLERYYNDQVHNTANQ